MDNKTKALIAVGASMAANCQACLSFNAKKAKEIGVEDQDLNEAIAIAKLVRKGAMGKMDQFSSILLKSAGELAINTSNEGCGCS